MNKILDTETYLEIDFQILSLEEHSFHILVPCDINNTRYFWVIDSGASQTVLSETMASDFNANEHRKKGPISHGIGTDEIASEKSIVPILELNKIEFTNIPVALINLDGINEIYSNYIDEKICGLIGCDFLIQHKAIIDFSSQKILINKKIID